MLPKELGKSEMDASQARHVHQGLIKRLMSGPGDSKGAMYRAEEEYNLSYWAQSNLRHKGRATKQFIASLRRAYLEVIMNSVTRDIEYLNTEISKGDADADVESLAAQAENLLAEIAARKAAQCNS